MSLKLRVKYKYRAILNFYQRLLLSTKLPAWMFGGRARLTAMLVFAVFAVLFVAETNKLGTSGYELHDLEGRITMLNNDIAKLTAASAESQSMASIQKRITDMATPEQIKYLGAGSQKAVAKR